MNRLTIFCSLTMLVVSSLAAQGQENAGRSPSVIRQTGYHSAGLWGGYGYTGGASCDCSPSCSSPCAPAGCGGEICHGYDNCCTCFPGLVCCLKKLGRTLDCLLPCHAYGSGCGGSCSRPHLFAFGRCGGCNTGCSTCAPSCNSACPTCDGPSGGPAATNPFQDDPEAPPVPLPDTNKDARRHPIWKSLATKATAAIPAAKPAAAPFKLTTDRPPSAAPRMLPAPKLAAPPKAIAATKISPANTEPAPIVTSSRRVLKPTVAPATIAAQPQDKTKPVATSVLRRASLEEEIQEVVESPAQREVRPTQALLPIQLDDEAEPVIGKPIRKATSLDIPHNPLRK